MRSDFSAERREPMKAETGLGLEPLASDRVIASEVLFEGRREIAIAHSGSFYRLKITRQGKLILNK